MPTQPAGTLGVTEMLAQSCLISDVRLPVLDRLWLADRPEFTWHLKKYL